MEDFKEIWKQLPSIIIWIIYLGYTKGKNYLKKISYMPPLTKPLTVDIPSANLRSDREFYDHDQEEIS